MWLEGLVDYYSILTCTIDLLSMSDHGPLNLGCILKHYPPHYDPYTNGWLTNATFWTE
jgi:hypothetical protein